MKRIWARVGITVEVTDEQYEELRQMALNESLSQSHGYPVYDDLDEFPDWLSWKIAKEGIIDGDSYVPSDCWDE